MKKMIAICMVFLLTFTTISPFPIFANEPVDFPGSVTGSPVDNNNEGTVSVTMNEAGYTLTLHKHRTNSSFEEQVGSPITGYTPGTATPFAKTGPGLYYVKAYKAADGDNPAIEKISAPVAVQPSALSVGADSTSNVISPAVGPYKLKITGVKGQRVQLYNNDSLTPIKELPVTASEEVTFDVDAGAKYQVVQIVNGAESLKSNYITVRPNIVTIDQTRTVHSGPTNNQGELFITGTKKGNTLVLYRGGVKTSHEAIADTTTYTFKGLSAGEYTVNHIENNVESARYSNPATIRNEQNPIIDLVDAVNYELRYEIDASHKVTAKKYEEPGYIVTDKNGTIYRGKKTAYFCGEEGSEIQEGAEGCTPLKIKVVVDDKVVIEDNVTPPGKYNVTYTATDGENNNLTSTITRNVTVYPNAVNLTKEDTEQANNGLPLTERKTGKITLHGVYQGATVKLYQDPNGSGNNIESATLIRANAETNDGVYSFPAVPVGKGYFVIQEVNGVASSPSARIEIKDDTPPELKLNGSDSITLEVGDSYIEYGAVAIDNIDTSEELTGKIQITGSVNTNRPGNYIIKYNVTDKAGNKAEEIERTILVKPRPVTAIGSIATLGEIGVEDIFPGAASPLETTLKLYKYDEDLEKFVDRNVDVKLHNRELTFVFKKYGPGRYYVTQTVNGQESNQSNIVEIVDTDRPYITLLGPEKIELTWDKDYATYYEKTGQKFTDPGAKADDYLEADKLTLTATMLEPNGTESTVTKKYAKVIEFTPNSQLSEPGIYKITYTARAERGSKADDKHRIISLAPPKVADVKAGNAGTGKVSTANGVFKHFSTTVTLYNTYGQAMDSKKVEDGTSVEFENVPAGLGYYVTQTVNGIESAPSEPVDVTLFGEAENAALITTFEFMNPKAVGVIDHEAGTIMVTVPKGTDVTNMKAFITSIGNVTGGPYDGTKGQNFTNKVTYTVEPKDPAKGTSKNYTVTVKPSIFDSKLWSDTVKKEVTFSSIEKSINLSPTEKAIATVNGVSFIAANRAIHVPAVNVQQANSATLTVSTPSTSSITQTTDPVWRTTINSATDIHWGNSTAPFLQPIEMEMPNPDKKVFAKLVRENGKLFAIVQPSKMVGDNILGLVTEPGTYALITPIAAPKITSTTRNNETTYSISAPGSEIYYTTNSSEITFDRSKQNHYPNKRDSQLESYSLESTPPDLSKWTVYKAGERISSHTGELYAFSMKDQMISSLSWIDEKTIVEWQKDLPTYSTHKVLKITFNSKVNPKALHSNMIYVKDDATGNIVETTLSLSADGKTVSITPTKAYTSNKQYTLYVERHMKGNTKDNEFLNDTLTRTFIVK